MPHDWIVAGPLFRFCHRWGEENVSENLHFASCLAAVHHELCSLILVRTGRGSTSLLTLLQKLNSTPSSNTSKTRSRRANLIYSTGESLMQ